MRAGVAKASPEKPLPNMVACVNFGGRTALKPYNELCENPPPMPLMTTNATQDAYDKSVPAKANTAMQMHLETQTH